MEITCSLSIEYNSKINAEKVLQSVKVDDYKFVTSKIQDNTIEATIKSKSIPSLLHTLDDYLACLSIAEKIVIK